MLTVSRRAKRSSASQSLQNQEVVERKRWRNVHMMERIKTD